MTTDLSSVLDARVATGSPGWSYSFSSDIPAILTLNFDVTHSGVDSYATVLFFQELRAGQLNQWGEFDTPPTSGSISLSIDPGIAYNLQIADNSNINQYLPALTSDVNATFSFSIVPVPEPTILLAVGLGLFSFGLRKRTRW
jgi:hypothetical protein